MDYTYDPSGGSINVGVGSIAPAPGTPAASSLDPGSGGGFGGILSSLGPLSQGLSNIGLQWFTASTRGVSGPLITPMPVQATPSAAISSTINQLAGYLPLIILAIAAIFIIKAVVK